MIKKSFIRVFITLFAVLVFTAGYSTTAYAQETDSEFNYGYFFDMVEDPDLLTYDLLSLNGRKIILSKIIENERDRKKTQAKIEELQRYLKDLDCERKNLEDLRSVQNDWVMHMTEDELAAFVYGSALPTKPEQEGNK